jgi:hypothetical protein
MKIRTLVVSVLAAALPGGCAAPPPPRPVAAMPVQPAHRVLMVQMTGAASFKGSGSPCADAARGCSVSVTSLTTKDYYETMAECQAAAKELAIKDGKASLGKYECHQLPWGMFGALAPVPDPHG